jgi:hypothetical protein
MVIKAVSTGGQRGAGRAKVGNVHRAVSLLDQEGPAGTEVAHGRLGKGFLESVIAAKLGVDGVSQFASGRTATLGLHATPEEGVVPDLGGVVVDATTGLLDDVFQRQRFKLRAGDQVVSGW